MKINKNETYEGVLYAFAAYLIWGLSVIFWKSLSEVAAFEVLMHRMIWSFIFLIPLVLIFKQKDDFLIALKDRKTFLILLLTTVIVGSNWFVFIWAINHDMILQTSLGYYINPIVNVFLGMIFLKEELRNMQKLAVLIAAGSVLFLALKYGEFPWISLYLAFSFGFYGLIRKMISVKPLAGLSIETLLLSIPAAIYLLYIEQNGTGSFLHINSTTDILLICTALVTATPLLFFTKGAKLLNLSTIGFLQYVAPTCGFLIAVFIYNEPLVRSQMIAFIFIWVALFVYSIDAYLYYKD
ncbi:MAG: EamA family transporter RarD [Deltaproteobacteria bacterium]|nr:EamA family transporter RarD [Deltaproteobacteria bacterium]